MSNVPLINVANRSSAQQSAAPVGAPLATVLKFIAGAALTPGRVVMFSTSPAQDDLVALPAGETSLFVGVYVGDRVCASGEEVPVAVAGVANAVCGASVTRGAKCTALSTGLLDVAAANESIVGIALKSGGNGDTIPLLVALSRVGDVT